MNKTVPLIIGLIGHKGSGKSSAAKIIENYLTNRGYRIKRDSFASPIRDMLSAIVDVDKIYKDDTKESPIPYVGVSLRKLMQSLGTEWGRGLKEDFWVNIMAHKYEGHFVFNSQPFETLIIDDVRFENEISWIKQFNGLLIHIDTELADFQTDTHQSESLPLHVLGENYPVTVFNNFDESFEEDLIAVIDAFYFKESIFDD